MISILFPAENFSLVPNLKIVQDSLRNRYLMWLTFCTSFALLPVTVQDAHLQRGIRLALSGRTSSCCFAPTRIWRTKFSADQEPVLSASQKRAVVAQPLRIAVRGPHRPARE